MFFFQKKQLYIYIYIHISIKQIEEERLTLVCLGFQRVVPLVKLGTRNQLNELAIVPRGDPCSSAAIVCSFSERHVSGIGVLLREIDGPGR